MLVETTLAQQALHVFGGHNARGGRLATAYAKANQVFCAYTFQEPYRLEGKKTMGLELAEQFGWRLPDVVVYPVGGGVGLIGIWKAFSELLELGWVEGRMPRFVVAQYAGCAPLVDAFQAGRETSEPWSEITTLPGGLRNAKPLADFLILQILRETGGAAIAVSGEDALEAVRDVMATDGVFMCPEAGTTIVAVRQMLTAGQLRNDETVAVLNTASGLKYTGLFPAATRRVADHAEAITA
jgi:threonine synthase